MKKILLSLCLSVLSLFAFSPNTYIEPYFSKIKGGYYNSGVDKTIATYMRQGRV